MKKQVQVVFVILAMVCLRADVFALEQLHIAFEPPLVPGGVKPLDDWVEQGVCFTGPEGFSQYDSGREGCPDNGTAYLKFALGPRQTLVIQFVDSTPFKLISVDLAEYSTRFPNRKTITFVGHKTNGATVTGDFILDGVIDGTGPLADFEIFTFGEEFSNLSYVEIPTTGYSMDNMVIAPGSGSTTLLGLEITGPEEVVEGSLVQYNTIVSYGNGFRLNVTTAAIWSVEPEMYGNIDENGLLRTKNIDEPLYITLYAEYTEGPVTLEAEIIVQVLPSRTLYVPSDYQTIQAAIEVARDGDAVVIADGTYTGEGNRDIDFLGKAITVRSTDPNDPNIVASTIIDCNGTGTEPHRGFYFHNGESTNSVLDGFTITNGYIRYTLEDYGGGIVCINSSPTIRNCIIKDNYAYEDGGGISCHNGSPTVRNCIIKDNSTWNDFGGGGGISCMENSNPTITDCRIIYNDTENGGGGGICSRDNSGPTIDQCVIMGNECGDWEGGGIACLSGSNMTITNCLIVGNSAIEDENHGGGIYCWGGTATISNCTIAGNRVDQFGSGGGIYCRESNVIIKNCILWGNTPDEIRVRSGLPPEVTYSNVPGGWPGTGNIDANPSFVNPGYWDDNGTPAEIWDDLWVDGDYHLVVGSPCIDAANDANVYTDIEGNIRPFDFPGVDNNGELPEFDMGAYETIVQRAELMILPGVINRRSRQRRIWAWVRLPEGITRDQIDSNEPLLLYPDVPEAYDIEAIRQLVFQNRRRYSQRTSILAFFDKAELMDAVGDNGRVELQVVGNLRTGQYFYGTDTVWIKSRRWRPWWHW